jgi:hypothetical protein
MDLTLFEVFPGNIDLRPAPRRRRWMDETPRAFAYHCLPLVIANLHGWEMLCPFSFEALWLGGAGQADVQIACDPDELRRRPSFVASHFGSGILSFAPLVIVRTAPGHNLWVSGPTNTFKDGIQAMSGSIEADWMPFTFSMNWKLTRPGLPVRFEKGEPFCSFFPIARGALAACEPRLAALDDDPALATAYRHAVARRERDEKLDGDHYQRWYTAGEMPDPGTGVAPPDHETNIAVKPFRR